MNVDLMQQKKNKKFFFTFLPVFEGELAPCLKNKNMELESGYIYFGRGGHCIVHESAITCEEIARCVSYYDYAGDPELVSSIWYEDEPQGNVNGYAVFCGCENVGWIAADGSCYLYSTSNPFCPSIMRNIFEAVQMVLDRVTAKRELTALTA